MTALSTTQDQLPGNNVAQIEYLRRNPLFRIFELVGILSRKALEPRNPLVESVEKDMGLMKTCIDELKLIGDKFDSICKTLEDTVLKTKYEDLVSSDGYKAWIKLYMRKSVYEIPTVVAEIQAHWKSIEKNTTQYDQDQQVHKSMEIQLQSLAELSQLINKIQGGQFNKDKKVSGNFETDVDKVLVVAHPDDHERSFKKDVETFLKMIGKSRIDKKLSLCKEYTISTQDFDERIKNWERIKKEYAERILNECFPVEIRDVIIKSRIILDNISSRKTGSLGEKIKYFIEYLETGLYKELEDKKQNLYIPLTREGVEIALKKVQKELAETNGNNSQKEDNGNEGDNTKSVTESLKKIQIFRDQVLAYLDAKDRFNKSRGKRLKVSGIVSLILMLGLIGVQNIPEKKKTNEKKGGARIEKATEIPLPQATILTPLEKPIPTIVPTPIITPTPNITPTPQPIVVEKPVIPVTPLSKNKEAIRMNVGTRVYEKITLSDPSTIQDLEEIIRIITAIIMESPEPITQETLDLVVTRTMADDPVGKKITAKTELMRFISGLVINSRLNIKRLASEDSSKIYQNLFTELMPDFYMKLDITTRQKILQEVLVKKEGESPAISIAEATQFINKKTEETIAQKP